MNNYILNSESIIRDIASILAELNLRHMHIIRVNSKVIMSVNYATRNTMIEATEEDLTALLLRLPITAIPCREHLFEYLLKFRSAAYPSDTYLHQR